MKVRNQHAQDVWDGWKLRAWRNRTGTLMIDLADELGIDWRTVYRIEAGAVPTIVQAHRIVAITRGQIRYRDIYRDFHPEYA